LDGRAICRFFSKPDRFQASVGMGRRVDLILNPNQIGPGFYTVGISIHDAATIENVSAVRCYDLLSRSFEIVIDLPDSLASAGSQFFHSSEWSFSKVILPRIKLSE
jgi:lipopolysaccharide transport system ATP-binding protein